MHLLHLPHELYDLITLHLPAPTISALSRTCRHFSHSLAPTTSTHRMHHHPTLPVVRTCLSLGASLTARDPTARPCESCPVSSGCTVVGGTLLHRAAARGDAELARFLVRRGVPVDVLQRGNRHRRSALAVALQTGNGEVARVILGGGPELNAVGEDVVHPLHAAVEAGEREIVEWLIREGADVNAEYRGERAICRARCPEVVEVLVDAGAEVEDVGVVATYAFGVVAYLLLTGRLPEGMADRIRVRALQKDGRTRI